MNPIITGAAVVTAIGTIGGGAMALDHLHVSAKQFEKYLEAQDTRYALELKKEIRQVKQSLLINPDDDYLNEHLIELIDALCEIRPKDKLCGGNPE